MRSRSNSASIFFGFAFLFLPLFSTPTNRVGPVSPHPPQAESNPLAPLGAQLWAEQHRIFETLFPGIRYDLERIPYQIDSLPLQTGPFQGWTAGGAFELDAVEVYALDFDSDPSVPSNVKALFAQLGLSFSQVAGTMSNSNGQESVFGLAIQQKLPGSTVVRFWPIGLASFSGGTDSSCSSSPSSYPAPAVPSDLCGAGCDTPNGKWKDQACIDSKIRAYQRAMANACIDYNASINTANQNFNACMKAAAKASAICCAAALLVGFFTGGVGGAAATVACAAKLAYDQLQCRTGREQAQNAAENKLSADQAKAKNDFNSGILDCCKPCPTIGSR